MAEKNKKKCHTALLLKGFHKFHLMGMNIGQRKGIRAAFFCIEAYRDPLYCSDIIHRTLLFKICQCDVTVIFIHTDRCDRCGNFLDQCQSFFPVLFIGPVYQFLQS